MKKFIAAFDSLQFPESTLAYGIDLARGAGAHLVGVFLEDPNLHSYGVAEMTNYSGKSFDRHVQELNRIDHQKRQEGVDRFRAACGAAGVTCSVHRDRHAPLRELLHESIYADLLLTANDVTPGTPATAAPTPFVRHLLQEAQCPIMPLPPHYATINRVTLLYDGAPASVQALRAFSYLLPHLKDLDTEVVTVKGSDDDGHLPDGRLIKEFVKRHFPQARYTVLKGTADEELVAHGRRHPGPGVIVLGAYRRDALSRMFRPSTADVLMKHLQAPLFIAHY
ncbi:MAG: universal stress protein [Chitinophagaceae bacterium]|nr:MAG: universal stress protein [Chitinophagaceae bacterium]